MRIDVTQIIKNLDGTEATSTATDGSVCKSCGQPILTRTPFTLRTALVRCLVNDEIDPRTGRPVPVLGPERYRCVKLAMRIEDTKNEIRLSVDQIKELKDLAAKFLSRVAQTRVWDILDPPEDEGIDTEE